MKPGKRVTANKRMMKSMNLMRMIELIDTSEIPLVGPSQKDNLLLKKLSKKTRKRNRMLLEDKLLKISWRGKEWLN